jgi:hypothetical protein
VLEPIGTHHAFDLAVLDGARTIVRVQCAGRQAYTGRADVFAVGDLDARDVYVLPVDLAGSRATSLRLEPARNGQRERILFAADHTVDAWVALLPTAAQRRAA